MPITHKPAPGLCFEVMERGVARVLAAEAEAVRWLDRSGSSPEATAPHPLYVVNTETIQQGALLEAARPIGWRYLILQESEAVAACTVRESKSGEVEFADLNHGRLIGLFAQAVGAAENFEAVQAGHFELRYLEVRSLYFAAAWLHGEEDILIPLEEHAHAGIAAFSPQRAEGILAMLQAQLEVSRPLVEEGPADDLSDR